MTHERWRVDVTEMTGDRETLVTMLAVGGRVPVWYNQK